MKPNEVIAVTGASRGIGAAIAVTLALRGFTVGCLSRGGEGPVGIEVAPDVASRFVNVACDVTNEESVKQAFLTLTKEAGHLKGLVNNAGIHLGGASSNFSTSDFNYVMATNTTAVFVACREAYPYLVAAGGGTIVNIGSFFDKMGVKRSLAYCASKAAVGSITRCLAVEWASKGIRVLDVAPGYIVTDLNREELNTEPLQGYLKGRIPVRAPAPPEDVSRLVASILSEEIPFLTGETIYIDGGQGIAH